MPKSSRDAVVGWLGDELKVMVSAAPDKGKANQAIVEVLAARLGVTKQSVRIVTGHGSPRKTVELVGIADECELRRRLG
ncbi:MAG: DUF167 domain-containing protein [Gammaproteobacteria bacterium]